MFIDLFRALEAGKELSNAKTWKKTQLWTSNVGILLGAGVSIAAAMGHPIPVTPEQLTTIVSAIAIFVGMFNSYTTVATTEKLGASPETNTVDTGTTDTSGHTNDAGLWFRELDDRGFTDTSVLKDK